MDRDESRTVEERLARLEVRGESRGLLIGCLILVLLLLYLLWSAGVLKLDFTAAPHG